MNTRINRIALALGLVIAGGAHASDATEFAVPTGSSITRAEVMAQTRVAQAAGELQVNDGSFRVVAPDMSLLSREQVRMQTVEAMETRSHGDRTMAGRYFVGGM
jgi:hypothetical protein